MKKTMSRIAMIGALMLGTAAAAQAQAPAADDANRFVNISVGGQFQSREFSSSTTFSLFNEDGTVTANQTIGGGLVFDATGGYRFWRNVAVAVGISTFNGSGEAAAIAAIPNPLFIGKPTLKEFAPSEYGDLSQSTVAVNFQLVGTWALTDRLNLSVFGGPSVMRVKQEFASATAELNSTAQVEEQSETTAKAGTVGADLAYTFAGRYGVGAFIRYAGGKVDFPAAEGLSVGGAQAGGGIRVRF